MAAGGGEDGANLLIGIFAVGFGVASFWGRESTRRRRQDLAASHEIEAERLEALFRPMEGTLFQVFNVWIGLAIIAVGISRFLALIPSLDGRYNQVFMVLGIGQVFFASGLQFIFTGRAIAYKRRLIWTNPRNWRPGFGTAVETLMVRFFGFIPLIIGGTVTYVCLAIVLAGLGVIDRPQFPWLN